MLGIGLILIGLGVHQPPPVDSVAVYAEILKQVRSEFAANALALATTRSGVHCMPMCGVRLRDPDGSERVLDSGPEVEHSVALLDTLRSLGLVEHACAVREGWYGCPDYPEHLFVALGEITTQPQDGPAEVVGSVWVKVALSVPCTRECDHPDAMGYWYLLRPEANRPWVIVRRAPGFTAG